MKHILTIFFAFVLGGILVGCGGGGGGGNALPEISSYRPLQIDINEQTRPENPDTAIKQIMDFINDQNNVNISVKLSKNRVPGNSLNNFHDVIVENANAGDIYNIAVVASGQTQRSSFKVFEQNSTLYLARNCGSPTNLENACIAVINGIDTKRPRVFTIENTIFSVQNRFYFNRGLIEDARQFGGFHINAENRHVEYRWTPFSYVFIDGGYRHLDNAAVSYAKLQTDYKNFYLQYMLGNVQSDYYKSGKIDGIAFGWQKDGFAVKAEKPFGNANESWLKLFYKRELK